MKRETKEQLIAYGIVLVIFLIGAGVYIFAMKNLPCDFFLRVGDAPTRCLEGKL